MPRLTITAESSAETFVGATGWASGSQLLTGTRPALTPNPAKESRNTAHRTPGGRPAAAARIAVKSIDPAPSASSSSARAARIIPASLIASMTKPACDASSWSFS